MDFECLVNKQGVKIPQKRDTRFALCHLWSRYDSRWDYLEAVSGNLYCSGIEQMMTNLAYNPQIIVLFIVGADMNGIKDKVLRRIEKYNEAYPERALIIKEELPSPADLDSYPHRDAGIDRMILESEIPTSQENQPVFDMGNRNVQRATIMEAWHELMFIVDRYGRSTQVLKKSDLSDRIELLNVKTTIKDVKGSLNSPLGEEFKNSSYVKTFLEPCKNKNFSYTYGNRICSWGKDELDFIKITCTNLDYSRHDRSCYWSVWDNDKDGWYNSSPCLVSLFFRAIDGKLNLTATFRTHNLKDAWLNNVYALATVLEKVAYHSYLEIGELCIISLSLTLQQKLSISFYERNEREWVPSKFEPVLDSSVVVEHCRLTGHIHLMLFDESGWLVDEIKALNKKEAFRKIVDRYWITSVENAFWISTEIDRVLGEMGEDRN